MRRAVAVASTAGIAGLAATALWFGTQGRHESVAESAGEHWGLLDRYCVECHNSVELTAGLAFDAMSPEEVPNNAETWEHVVAKLRGGLMPPPGGGQPPADRVESFVGWMEAYLDEAAAAAPRQGRVGLHRFNRREYANAVRDLLGVEIDPSTLLPPDDASAGFDNNASTLTSSPLFLSQLVDAARLVANLAVGVDAAEPLSQVYDPSNSKEPGGTRFGRPSEVGALPLGARDGIVVTHAFPVDGEYEINIDNVASYIFPNRGAQFRNRIIVTVDGEIVHEASIGGDEDLKTLDQDQASGADAIHKRVRNIRFTVEAGQREVAVLFARRTHAESEELIETFSQNIGRAGNLQPLLSAGSLEIRGPIEVSSRTAASRERIFSCYPETVEEQDACAEEIIRSLATLAYRRALTQRDMDERLAYYRLAKESDGFEGGIRMAIIGILASPHFLFRVDDPAATFLADTSPTASTSPVSQLNDFDLASKLAFFLWSSLPDEELLAVAATGQLRDPDVLESQVRRMLSDARAETLAKDFAHQWLQLGRMDSVRPDPSIFPGTAGRLDPRSDFLREVNLFIDSIFREDRSVLDLLSADHTFVNETLAWRYGIEGIRGNHFRRVRLEQSTRWGLLGKGAFLLASSYPNRTSPVLRGDYILHNIIGVPPPPPPPDVDTNLESVAPERALTVRERLAVHSENPSCNSCHGVMDPLGFALENFNVDGTWRDTDAASGSPIDASGMLPDGTEIDGPDELREVLLGRPEQFVQTFVVNLLSYSLGRKAEWYDMPAVRKIVRDSAVDDYRFSAVVVAIAQSVPFGVRTVVNGEASETVASAAH